MQVEGEILAEKSFLAAEAQELQCLLSNISEETKSFVLAIDKVKFFIALLFMFFRNILNVLNINTFQVSVNSISFCVHTQPATQDSNLLFFD